MFVQLCLSNAVTLTGHRLTGQVWVSEGIDAPHCSFDLLVFLLLILLFICSIGLVRRGGKIEMEKVANKKKCFFCSLTRSLSLSSLRIFSLLAHFLVHYLGRLAGSISRVALLSSFLIVELFFFFSKDTLSHTHTHSIRIFKGAHTQKKIK